MRHSAYVSAVLAGVVAAASARVDAAPPGQHEAEASSSSDDDAGQIDQEDVEARRPVETQPNLWPSHQLFLAGHLTGGGPYGQFGFSGGYEPVGWISLEAGVGVTPYLPRPLRPQIGAMLRLRWPAFTHVAFGAELGPSVGGYRGDGDISILCVEGGCRRFEWDTAIWIQTGLNIEARAKNRVFYRIHSGFATMTNPGDAKVRIDITPDARPPAGITLFYLGFTVGGLVGL